MPLTPVRLLLALLAVLQAALGLRVVLRLLRTGLAARPVEPTGPVAEAVGSVAILVPTLNEERRLGACLDGLIGQGPEVTGVVVIDGGSTDETVGLARRYAALDRRVRVIDASPVPADWNGKAWNLQRGLDTLDPGIRWVLTIDADVRPRPGLAAALLAHATATDVAALSGATRQRLSRAAEGLLHPALLTSLVYRYGIPGGTTSDPAEVQANGQCMLIRRDALAMIGGFRGGQHSLCEDVTVARLLAAGGHRVGFAETRDLVEVEMYEGARETWANWPRSLTMLDRSSGRSVAVRLAEVVFTQGLPLLIAVAGGISGSRSRHRFPTGGRPAAHSGPAGGGRAVALLMAVNRSLLGLRVGVLIGMARAYRRPPPTYWLSPLLDPAVAARLVQSALTRTHTWRGRTITRG